MRFLKSTIGLAVGIFVPLLAFLWLANLPESEPEIPANLKLQGVHAFRGESVEEILGNASLQVDGEQLVFACPTTILATEDAAGLCGYCKYSEVIVYPSWQPGFTERLKAADFDFRSFYDDVLHKRYVMKTHGFDEIFEAAKSFGWQSRMGKWFTCRSSADQLDVTAYVEIRYSVNDENRFKFELSEYQTLGDIRLQPFGN